MPGGATAYLVIKRDDGYGDVFALHSTQRYTLGRATTNNIVLKDDLCSREHAEVSYADGHWQVANRGRNGLRLNGKTVSGQQAVADGDLIHWGHQADALTSLVQIGPQP